MSSKPTIIIDGVKCLTKMAAAQEFTTKLKLSRGWNGGLDALDDMLSGGFGAPEGEFVVEWRDSKRSEGALGSHFKKIVVVLKNHSRIDLRLN